MPLLLILFSVCIYRVAELDRRRGWLWAAINVIVTVLISQLIVSAYFSSVAGLLLSFALMTAANIYKPVKKGPFLS